MIKPKSLHIQLKYKYAEMKNSLRTSCSPAVGREDFKELKTEDGAVQPITLRVLSEIPSPTTNEQVPIPFRKEPVERSRVACSRNCLLYSMEIQWLRIILLEVFLLLLKTSTSSKYDVPLINRPIFT